MATKQNMNQNLNDPPPQIAQADICMYDLDDLIARAIGLRLRMYSN